MAEEFNIKIKTAAEMAGVVDATTGFAGQTEALDRMKAAAEALTEKMKSLDGSNAVLATGMADVVEKVDQVDAALKDAAETAEAHGESSEASALKTLVLGQAAQNLGQGLGTLAQIAKDNGMEDLASKLQSASAAMQTFSAVASFLGPIQAYIAAAGGLRAALVALRATMVASLATMGPLIAAVAAGAAAYYALRAAADAYMGTVEEMDAKNEAAAVAIGGVTVSHEEEKAARDAATESIQGYRDALSAANDELEKNLELAGNQEQIEKAKIAADTRRKSAEIDAQASAFERSGGTEGLSPEQVIVARQRLAEEKIARTTRVEEAQRQAEETALKKAADARAKELDAMRQANDENNGEINGADGRFNLSPEERRALIQKGKEVAEARTKYGAGSDEVAQAMSEYTALAVQMNEDEKADLLKRITLREELRAKIEAAANDLSNIQKQLDKTMRDNDKDRTITKIENEGDIESSRTTATTRAQEERARQREAANRAAQQAADKAREELRQRARGLGSDAGDLARSGDNAAVKNFGKDVSAALKDGEASQEELDRLSGQISAALKSGVQAVRILAQELEAYKKEQENLKAQLRNR